MKQNYNRELLKPVMKSVDFLKPFLITYGEYATDFWDLFCEKYSARLPLYSQDAKENISRFMKITFENKHIIQIIMDKQTLIADLLKQDKWVNEIINTNNSQQDATNQNTNTSNQSTTNTSTQATDNKNTTGQSTQNADTNNYEVNNDSNVMSIIDNLTKQANYTLFTDNTKNQLQNTNNTNNTSNLVINGKNIQISKNTANNILNILNININNKIDEFLEKYKTLFIYTEDYDPVNFFKIEGDALQEYIDNLLLDYKTEIKENLTDQFLFEIHNELEEGVLAQLQAEQIDKFHSEIVKLISANNIYKQELLDEITTFKTTNTDNINNQLQTLETRISDFIINKEQVITSQKKLITDYFNAKRDELQQALNKVETALTTLNDNQANLDDIKELINAKVSNTDYQSFKQQIETQLEELQNNPNTLTRFEFENYKNQTNQTLENKADYEAIANLRSQLNKVINDNKAEAQQGLVNQLQFLMPQLQEKVDRHSIGDEIQIALGNKLDSKVDNAEYGDWKGTVEVRLQQYSPQAYYTNARASGLEARVRGIEEREISHDDITTVAERISKQILAPEKNKITDLQSKVQALENRQPVLTNYLDKTQATNTLNGDLSINNKITLKNDGKIILQNANYDSNNPQNKDMVQYDKNTKQLTTRSLEYILQSDNWFKTNIWDKVKKLS